MTISALIVDPIFRGSRLFYSWMAFEAFQSAGFEPRILTRSAASRLESGSSKRNAVGSRTMAALTFSGSAGTDAVALKAKALRQALVEAKLLTAEEAEATPFELARFNPPFTLPPLRTNEIMIPVDDAAASRVCES